MNAAGNAYGLLENWLVGSVSSQAPCTQSPDATWYCALTLPNGDAAQIVWNSNTTSSKAVNSAFTTYRTLENGIVNPIAGNTVPVGSEPILLTASRKH